MNDKKESKKDTVTMFFRDVPRETRNKFKGWCGYKGITMTQGILLLIQEHMDQLENNKEKSRSK